MLALHTEGHWPALQGKGTVLSLYVEGTVLAHHGDGLVLAPQTKAMHGEGPHRSRDDRAQLVVQVVKWWCTAGGVFGEQAGLIVLLLYLSARTRGQVQYSSVHLPKNEEMP